jgi:hypothetical protein
MNVQTEFYTDENSHPIRLLALHHPSGFHVIASQVPEQIDAAGLFYEFDMVYFEDDWHKQSPPLFVFDGRCVWHEDKTIDHSWWEFKGTIIPATVPEWGEL